MTAFVARPVSEAAVAALRGEGVDPLFARLLAARGVTSRRELDYGFDALLPVSQLLQAERAAVLLADAIAASKHLVIVADYDADGATACAIGLRALRAFGARVSYLVPNRFTFGYGLTPELVRVAAERKPHMLITVDNGIASHAGVDEAKRLGIEVIITDHHLPAAMLPAAACIVNPNQPGCAFPSKALAGCGVMFYVMLALRAELRRRGAFATRDEPNLASLLDLVALGTVADVVPLDRNNRLLVSQGLQRIRAGRMQPGVAALFLAAGRDAARATTFDLAFAIGPRLNAAGRLEDMSLGIECLVTDDAPRATQLACELDRLNRERREIEDSMREDAHALLAAMPITSERVSVALYHADWHQGVVGILASRVREATHRPTICFAPAGDGTLRGSGRSIRGVHLRDALDLVTKRAPALIQKFGGHAMAAGLSIAPNDFDAFCLAFEAAVAEIAPAEVFAPRIETDGSFDPSWARLESVQAMERGIWGQAFPAPLFSGSLEVLEQRVVAEKHLKLRVLLAGRPFTAMRFGNVEPLAAIVDAAYRVTLNEHNGTTAVELVVEHIAS